MVALFALVVGTFAAPVNVDQQFCLSVDVDFSDDEGGDYWTDTDLFDKPARGFSVEVRRHSGAGSTLLWSGWTEEDSGSEAGCTPLITMQYDVASPTAYQYLVRVESENAKVNGNTIHSYVDPLIADEVITDVMVFHQAKVANAKIYAPPLNGGPGGDDRWNVLATAAFALGRNDGGVDATYTFGEAVPGGAQYDNFGYHAATNHVYLDDRRRWVYMHELGHAVSEAVSGDLGHDQDYEAPMDNCGPPSSTVHHLLSKEWNSAAAVEGIATWYAQITFNAVYTSADCTLTYWKDVDWDLDGDVDDLSGTMHDCIGDPDGPSTYADEVHWLDNLIAAPDLQGCTGSSDNLGVEYDWSRYLWSMTTEHGYTVGDMWDVWSAAGPGTWDANGSTVTLSDDPGVLMAFYAWTLLDPFQLDPGNEAAVADHGIYP